MFRSVFSDFKKKIKKNLHSGLICALAACNASQMQFPFAFYECSKNIVYGWNNSNKRDQSSCGWGREKGKCQRQEEDWTRNKYKQN